jgi:hypothetical protein
VTAHNNTYINYPPKRSQDFLLVVSTLRIIFFYEHRGIIGSKSETPITPLPHFQGFIEQGEGKRRTYLFVTGEGHDEDLGIWRRHR